MAWEALNVTCHYGVENLNSNELPPHICYKDQDLTHQCYQIHRGPARESSVVTSGDVTWFSHCGGQKHEDIPIIGSGKHVPCCCPNDLDNLGPCRNLHMGVIGGGSSLALAWPHVCLAPSRWCCWEVVETLEDEASCRMQVTWNTCWKAILSWPLPLSASCLPRGEWLSSTKPFHHGSLALIQAKKSIETADHGLETIIWYKLFLLDCFRHFVEQQIASHHSGLIYNHYNWKVTTMSSSGDQVDGALSITKWKWVIEKQVHVRWGLRWNELFWKALWHPRKRVRKERWEGRAHQSLGATRLFRCGALVVDLCHNTLGQRHGTYNTGREGALVQGEGWGWSCEAAGEPSMGPLAVPDTPL